MRTLETTVGPNGEWETWLVIDSADVANHAANLIRRFPSRWRIVEA
jgi:hypothetical protein